MPLVLTLLTLLVNSSCTQEATVIAGGKVSSLFKRHQETKGTCFRSFVLPGEFHTHSTPHLCPAEFKSMGKDLDSHCCPVSLRWSLVSFVPECFRHPLSLTELGNEGFLDTWEQGLERKERG